MLKGRHYDDHNQGQGTSSVGNTAPTGFSELPSELRTKVVVGQRVKRCAQIMEYETTTAAYTDIRCSRICQARKETRAFPLRVFIALFHSRVPLLFVSVPRPGEFEARPENQVQG